MTYDFDLHVPADLDVALKTVNGGELRVTGVHGRFELRNVNGGVEAKDLTGAGTATTVNGPLKVSFAANPDGDSTFRTVNGDVDLTFRDGLAADLEVKTFNGETYADFPVVRLAQPAGLIERDKGTKFAYRRDREMRLRVGAGGPQLRFETINGDILLRNGDGR